MNRKLPIVRILVFLVMSFAIIFVKRNIEVAIQDDIAVASMNDPTSNRALIVYEDARGSMYIASFGVLGLVGVWTLIGFKKKEVV